MGSPHGKLMKMFDQEQRMLNHLQRYIKQQETSVRLLERHLREVWSSVPREVDRDQYVRHAINNYLLVRRLVFGWSKIARIASLFSTPRPNVRWPGLEDLSGVMRYLFRLQQTYQLKTAHLAHGFVDGDQADVVVTGLDTFLMAEANAQSHDFQLAKEWLDNTIAKADNTVSFSDILELKVLSVCFLGESTGSISALTQLLEDFPDFKPSPYLLNTWQTIANFDCPTHKQALENMRYQHSMLDPNFMTRFNTLCRAVTGSSLQPQHVLSCRYVHYNKTRLRLGPFRAEELQLDPPVLLFHDVISDAEIREVQKCAIRSKMEASEIYNERDEAYVNRDRSSESSDLRPRECSVMVRLLQRLGDMTNLDVATAETSQVTRYGVGGEYLFHFDNDILSQDCSRNCRIATLITYLNDVPSGGHTVFRQWGLSVRPQKRTALFWFNYHRNGTGDVTTDHAGCPVIRGSKWVLNLWFHHFNSFPSCFQDDNRSSFKYFYV
uniref:procollagen-proline 4-dioxygenase n=2 Tax=Cuerna arida TaxID=1464854 RepID=A0A1B6GEX8_9HEMI